VTTPSPSDTYAAAFISTTQVVCTLFLGYPGCRRPGWSRVSAREICWRNMDLAASEDFARRPRIMLPARIRCAAISRSPAGLQSRCGTLAAVAVDVSCRSCGTRRVFLCDTCLDEARWQLEPGLLWCAQDGAPVIALTTSAPSAGPLPWATPQDRPMSAPSAAAQ
jgi:hypothetical protein